MKRPPMLMRVRIDGRERNFLLWLPLFLLLPVVLVLLIILSPLILIAIVILRLRGRERQLSPTAEVFVRVFCSVRGIKAAIDLLCSMPGLRVDIYNHSERIYVSVV